MYAPLISTASVVARGLGQIFFVRSALTGLGIVIGLSFSSWSIAGLVVLGSLVQTFGAYFLQHRRSEVDDGLMGYNGALVGAAAAWELGGTWPAVLVTVVGSFACIPVHEMIRWLWSLPWLRRFDLPVSTAPFCIIAGLEHGAIVPLLRTESSATPVSSFSGYELGLFQDFSEVILSTGLVTGLVIVLSLFLGSWKIGVASLAGSALAIGFGIAVHSPTANLSAGLTGYSAVLAAIALGAVVLPERPWGVRAGAVVAGVGLTLAFNHLLALTGGPVFTWPFLLSMWLVMVVLKFRKARIFPRAVTKVE